MRPSTVTASELKASHMWTLTERPDLSSLFMIFGVRLKRPATNPDGSPQFPLGIQNKEVGLRKKEMAKAKGSLERTT